MYISMFPHVECLLRHQGFFLQKFTTVRRQPSQPVMAEMSFSFINVENLPVEQG